MNDTVAPPVSAEKVVVLPRLEVELLKADYAVLCASVSRVDGGFAITAAARPSTFGHIGAICAESGGHRTFLFFSKDEGRSTSDLIVFRVLVPVALTKQPLAIVSIDKNSGERTALTAGRKTKLPAKWFFAPYSLGLSYAPSAPAAVVEERCFLRAFELDGDVLSVDLSIFRPESKPVDDETSSLELRRGDSGEVIFSVELSLAPAKKAFRVPASLHKHFSEVSIAHAAVKIPIASILDEAAVYDLVVNSGGTVSSVYPYNRYYYEKPSSLIVNSNGTIHVLRHFADPESSVIRFAYQ
jgi:hypothetical protein